MKECNLETQLEHEQKQRWTFTEDKMYVGEKMLNTEYQELKAKYYSPSQT